MAKKNRTVDEHVVEMKFNNEEFEKKSKATMATLDSLKEKLRFKNASDGLNELSKSMKNVNSNANFNGLTSSLDKVSVKFSALNTISDTFWRSLTNNAIATSRKVVSALNAPIQQIINGGKQRALNIEQAKFQLQGLGIEWAAIEEDINYGVQDTAYGLDSAAKAAAQLSASQVALGDDMKAALRGISGVAAMTNSEYDEIANIFTTVAGNGRLMGMQLTQLSTKGFNAAATIAKYLNSTEAEVRDMVSKGLISFDTFSKAMDDAFGEHAKDANKTFNGALSNTKAALSRLGAEPAAAGFEALRKVFIETISVLNHLKKSASPVYKVLNSGIEKFGDLAVLAVKKIDSIVTGTSFSKFMTVIAANMSSAIDKVHSSLLNFVNENGISNTLGGLHNLFANFLQIIRVFKRAWSNVFPKTLKKEVDTLAYKFKNFTEKLKLSNDAQEGLRKVIELLLHPLKFLSDSIEKITGKSFDFVVAIHKVIDSVLAYIGIPELHRDNPLDKLFNNKIVNWLKEKVPSAINKTTTSLTKFVGKIKEIWTKLKALPQFQEMLESLKKLGNYAVGFIAEAFGKLGDLNLVDKINVDSIVDKLGWAIQKFVDLKNKIKDFFSDFSIGSKDIDKVNVSLEKTNANLGKFTNTIEKTTSGLNLEGITSGVMSPLSKFGDFFENGFVHLKEFLDGLSAGKIILTSFGVGIDLLLFNLVDFSSKATKFIGEGKKTLKSISGLFDSMSSTFAAAAAANLIESIGKALLMFAASMWIVAQIPTERIEQVATILGIFAAAVAGFVTLIGLIDKFSKAIPKVGNSFINTLKATGKAFIGAAALIGTLAISLYLLSDTIAKHPVESAFAFAAIAAMLYELVYLFEDMSTKLNGKEVVKGIGTMIAIGFAIGTLVGSIMILSMLPTNKLIPAGFAVAGLLLVLAKSAEIAGQATSVKGIFGILAISTALLMVVGSLILLAFVPWNKIIDNVGAIGVVIAVLALFVGLAAKWGTNINAGGIGILAISASMLLLTIALKQMASIDGEAIKKSVGVFTYLAVIIIALSAISSKLGQTQSLSKTFLPLIAMIGSIYLFTKMLAMLAKIPADQLDQATKALVVIFIGMAAVVMALNQMAMAGKKVDWKMLLGIAAIVATIAIAIGVLASVGDEGAMWAATGAFFAGLVGMAAVIWAISKMKFEKGTFIGLLGIAVILGTLGYFLSKMANSANWGTILAAGVAIGVVFLALAGAIKIIEDTHMTGPKMQKVAKAIIVMSLAMAVIAASIAGLAYVISGTGISSALISFGALLVSMLAIAGIFELFKKSNITGPEMDAIANSFLKMAIVMAIIAASIAGLSYMAMQDPGAVTQSFIALMLALLSFVGIFKLLDTMGVTPEKLTAYTSAMIGMSVAMLIISAAMVVMGIAFNKMANVPWYTIFVAGLVMAGLMAALYALGSAISDAPLIAAGVAVITVAILGVAVAMLAFAKAQEIFINALIVLIQALPALAQSVADFIQVLANNAPQMAKNMALIGFYIMYGLASGVLMGIPAVLQAVFDTIKAIKDVFCGKSGFEVHSPSEWAKWLGKNVMLGLSTGFKESLKSGPVIGMTKSSLAQIKDAITTGFGTNITEEAEKAGAEAGEANAESYNDSFQDTIEKYTSDAMSNMQDKFDINSVWSQIGESAGFDYISGMQDGINSSTLDLSNIVNMDNVNLPSEFQNMMNGNVSYGSVNSIQVDNTETNRLLKESVDMNRRLLNGIDVLHTDIQELGKNASNMGVYIDGNTLAGKITPYINKNLGSTYVKNARSTGASYISRAKAQS